MTRLLFNSIGSLDAFRVAGSMLKRLNRCLAAIWSTKTYQNHATAFAVCVSNSFGYFGADQQRATKRQLLTKLHNPAQSLDCILFGQRNDMRTSLFPSLSLSAFSARPEKDSAQLGGRLATGRHSEGFGDPRVLGRNVSEFLPRQATSQTCSHD